MGSPRHRERVSFAGDAELVPLDDVGFDYSARMEAIFDLNSTATRIWRACAEETPLAEVIARTRNELDLPYEAAAASTGAPNGATGMAAPTAPGASPSAARAASGISAQQSGSVSCAKAMHRYWSRQEKRLTLWLPR